jgi:hypothetical protein
MVLKNGKYFDSIANAMKARCFAQHCKCSAAGALSGWESLYGFARLIPYFK